MLDPPSPPQALREEIDADWLVIGAGFAGIAAAHRLAELNPTDRIVMLEASRVGAGPAGRNSGFMIDLPHDLTSEDYGGDLAKDLAQIAANRHALAFAARMARTLGLDRDVFDPCGKVNGAATAAGDALNRRYAQHLVELDEPHEILDAQAMRALTGTDYYSSGLFTPGTTMIQPAAFVRAAAGALISNRVKLHEETPVTDLAETAAGWRAQTPRGAVRAQRVILAVNGHLENFGFKTRQLLHVLTYASMTRRLTDAELRKLGGEARWGLTPADPLGTTVRRLSGAGGDRLLIRNRFTNEPSLEVSDAALARITARHDASFAARFPMLRGVDMEFRWGGRLCLTRNGVGVTGEVAPGLWAACVQNGLGTVRGLLSGLAAAENASGAAPTLAQGLLDEPESARLPPAPITTLGARAVLRFQEWRAGREL